MLRTRLLTAVILIPIVTWLTYQGGAPFLALATLLLTAAEVEFYHLQFHRPIGTPPASLRSDLIFGISLVWLFLIDAHFTTLSLLQPGMVVILLSSWVWQLAHHQLPLSNWSLNIASGLYIGLCGSRLIMLRSLPHDGLWWTLTVVPATLIADTGAYLIGSIRGRHKLVPSLSFGKTWEGYVGGILVSGPTTALLAYIWQANAGSTTAITVVHGLIIGTLIATLAPLGDLTVSMIKRQAGVKDSGNLFPGHGGALDRVDSILWAAAIGYYYVLWFT